MRIVCASDTHSENLKTKWEWPEGDVLIIAGDLTSKGHHDHVKKKAREMLDLPYRWRIVVPGNHDKCFWETSNDKYLKSVWELMPGIIILQNEGVTIGGLNFYGTSWYTFRRDITSETPKWEALNFNLLWRDIPTDTDVLITHMPPYGIMDRREDDTELGSETLRAEVTGRVKPLLHVFGHAHKDHGVVQFGRTTYVNAALVDNERNPAFSPVIIDIEKRGNAYKAIYVSS